MCMRVCVFVFRSGCCRCQTVSYYLIGTNFRAYKFSRTTCTRKILIFARYLFSRTLLFREISVLIFAHFRLLREFARKFVPTKICTNKVMHDILSPSTENSHLSFQISILHRQNNGNPNPYIKHVENMLHISNFNM